MESVQFNNFSKYNRVAFLFKPFKDFSSHKGDVRCLDIPCLLESAFFVLRLCLRACTKRVPG